MSINLNYFYLMVIFSMSSVYPANPPSSGVSGSRGARNNASFVKKSGAAPRVQKAPFEILSDDAVRKNLELYGKVRERLRDHRPQLKNTIFSVFLPQNFEKFYSDLKRLLQKHPEIMKIKNKEEQTVFHVAAALPPSDNLVDFFKWAADWFAKNRQECNWMVISDNNRVKPLMLVVQPLDRFLDTKIPHKDRLMKEYNFKLNRDAIFNILSTLERDLNVKDLQDRSVLDYATKEPNNDEMVQILVDLGYHHWRFSDKVKQYYPYLSLPSIDLAKCKAIFDSDDKEVARIFSKKMVASV